MKRLTEYLLFSSLVFGCLGTVAAQEKHPKECISPPKSSTSCANSPSPAKNGMSHEKTESAFIQAMTRRQMAHSLPSRRFALRQATRILPHRLRLPSKPWRRTRRPSKRIPPCRPPSTRPASSMVNCSATPTAATSPFATISACALRRRHSPHALLRDFPLPHQTRPRQGLGSARQDVSERL